MPKWYNYFNPLYIPGIKNLLKGTPEKTESNLLPEQEPLYEQLQGALQGPGAGGAYGTAADYYYDLLSRDPQAMENLSAPELRRFNEQIIPDLAEQFAGMGSGGLSSSGFRNAAVSAGTDLSERLGAIRENLRAQGAAGLSNLGQQGLEDRKIIRPGKPGFLESFAPAAANAAVQYYSGGTASLPNASNQPPPQSNSLTPPPSASMQNNNIAALSPVGAFGQNKRVSTKGQSSPYGPKFNVNNMV